MKIMKIYYIYVLLFMALTGLGIVFLNAESILAFCFFIFFSLVLKNAQSLGESLEDTRQQIKSEFLKNLVKGQKDLASTHKMHLFKKAQLLKCIEHFK